MTEKMSKGDAGASCGDGICSNSSVTSTSENKQSILQKQMSISSRIGQVGFGAHNNACTGSKADEIEVIETGNCQPRHPKVSGT